MANSLKNVTIPLTANLNMNRNKSLTCSSYDILNGINAPVFGGSISPLHYKIDYQGDAKYSVDGERWTMDSNKLYRGGLLFKNFTGEYTFDMVDTKLDLDGLVPYSNYYVGFKLKTSSLDWYKVNENFQIETSGVVKTITSPESINIAKIVVRDNHVLIFYKQKELDKDDVLWDCIAVKVWNGNDFSNGASSRYKAEKQASSTSVTSITAKEYQETSSTQPLITVSQSFNGQIGVSVFNDRPRGTNAFKNVYVANFLFNTDGSSSTGQISLRSGKNIAPNVSVDGSGYSGRENRTTFAYFVDNKKQVQSTGTVYDSRNWDWEQVQSDFDYLTASGSSGDHTSYYPVENTYHPSAMVLVGRENSLSDISSIGSCSLTVNYNGYGRMVVAGYGHVPSAGTTGEITAPCVDIVVDTQSQNSIYNAGVTSNASIPTTADGWTSWWDNRNTSDNTCWNPAGMRSQIGDTNFYTLFNGKEGNAAGISYAINKNHVGTLLTEWGSIVQTFENCATSDKVIFKDAKTNTVKYIQRRSNITLNDIEVVGKYLLVRCTADENIYDISSGKWAKFANDWNNRILLGYQNPIGESNVNRYVARFDRVNNQYLNSWATSGSVAAGYDVAFQKEKGFAPSRLYNYTSLSGIVLGEVNAFGYELTSENGLDVFASSGTSAPVYKTTLFGNGASSCVSNLAGGVYPITSSGSAYFNIPIIESTVVDSYNGKYGLKIDGSVYTIAYDGIRPIALYNTSSIVDQVDDFFIVQSQYYALINGYICSLSYSSSNVISGVEQIVNVQGMKFIGAFPSCAYFYSPSARAIFAFTGDADLQLFVQTDRITEIYNSKYYSNCEWIFMSTNDGTYVLTQNNTFRIDSMNVKRFFPTDDEYCVLVLDNETNDNIFISMNRYSGWNTIPVVLETSFFGEGDMKKSTITDWYIRIFKGDEDYNGTVKCSAKTITDIVSQVVKTFDGTKEEKLTKDKFDANDNAMITFHTGCNALGTSCKVVSDYPICYFGFSIGSDGSTNKSRINI